VEPPFDKLRTGHRLRTPPAAGESGRSREAAQGALHFHPPFFRWISSSEMLAGVMPEMREA